MNTDARSKAFNFGPTDAVATASQSNIAVLEKEPEQAKTQVATTESTPKVLSNVDHPETAKVQENAPTSIQNVTSPVIQNAPKKRGRKPKIVTNAVVVPAAPVVKLTARQEFVQDVLKKAKIEKIPSIESLFEGKPIDTMTSLKLSELGVFSGNHFSDEVLSDLRKDWKLTNTLHQSSEINARNVFNVAVEIVSAGKMYMSIEAVQLPNGSIEVFSGRHRAVFLALFYGMDVNIPVVLSTYDQSHAKDAVIVANETRRIGSLEKSENKILGKIHGATEIDREELFKTTVTKKSDVSEYAAYSSFISHEYGTKLKFKIAEGSTRHDGELTTVTGIKGYWKRALIWEAAMTRKEFDDNLRESCHFLNAIVESMQKIEGFDCKQHLSSMVLVAIGGIFRHYKDSNKNPLEISDKMANAIVSSGEIGRNKSEKTYREILKIIS